MKQFTFCEVDDETLVLKSAPVVKVTGQSCQLVGSTQGNRGIPEVNPTAGKNTVTSRDRTGKVVVRVDVEGHAIGERHRASFESVEDRVRDADASADQRVGDMVDFFIV